MRNIINAWDSIEGTIIIVSTCQESDCFTLSCLLEKQYCKSTSEVQLSNCIRIALDYKFAYFFNNLAQGFPTFLLTCTLQHFDRCTCTPMISYDNTFYHDYS